NPIESPVVRINWKFYRKELLLLIYEGYFLMKYVIGIDLGTSAVKVLLMNQNGKTIAEASENYPFIQVANE
uniref:hypothetical protein n=1 Tax=uncultured Rummeliibacillus sp. TaxID=762292 RepID=UPI0026039FF7